MAQRFEVSDPILPGPTVHGQSFLPEVAMKAPAPAPAPSISPTGLG